jgi:hypothetical protein
MAAASVLAVDASSVSSCRQIQLADQDPEIEPVPTMGGGRKPETEIDRLSNILKTFNDLFGNIPWTDGDRVHKLITEDIPARVSADKDFSGAAGIVEVKVCPRPQVSPVRQRPRPARRQPRQLRGLSPTVEGYRSPTRAPTAVRKFAEILPIDHSQA